MNQKLIVVAIFGFILSVSHSRAADESWRGTTESEREYFRLGDMYAYAGAINNEVKLLGLSAPLTPEETDAIIERATMIAEYSNVEIYLETDLLVTDLWPASAAKDKNVLMFYRDDTLDKYLAIKADKEELVKNGRYTGESREEIARRFGRLLSYSEKVIERKISETSSSLDR